MKKVRREIFHNLKRIIKDEEEKEDRKTKRRSLIISISKSPTKDKQGSTIKLNPDEDNKLLHCRQCYTIYSLLTFKLRRQLLLF